MAEYIDKDKLLEDIEHNVVFTLRPDKPSSINAELRGANKIIDRIQCAPAADVQPVRHGRWISVSSGKRFGTVVRLDKDGCSVGSCLCSECGEWLTASDEYPVIGYYCPNCGAKMDGGVNDAAD